MDELHDKMMRWAGETAELVVGRVEEAMRCNPALSAQDAYDEIARTSHIGPMSDRIARMKLGIE
jgi:hypothetical protein